MKREVIADERTVAAWYLVRRREPLRHLQAPPAAFQHEQLRRAFDRARELGGDLAPSDLGIDSETWEDLHHYGGELDRETSAAAEDRVVKRYLTRVLHEHVHSLKGTTDFVRSMEVLRTTLDVIQSCVPIRFDTIEEAAHSAETQRLEWLPMAHPEMQDELGGWPVTKIIMVGGMTSQHKTTFVLGEAMHVAKKVPAGYLNLEDETPDLGRRALAAHADRTTVSSLVRGERDRDDIEAARRRVDRGGRLLIHSEKFVRLSRAETIIRAMHRCGVKFCAVDHFHLLRPDVGEKDFGFADLLSYRMHDLAARLGMCILLVGQLDKVSTRTIANTQGRIPHYNDLKYGNTLAQNAFGAIMVGLLRMAGWSDQARPGSLPFMVDVQKWKTAHKQPFRFAVEPAHDRIRAMNEQERRWCAEAAHRAKGQADAPDGANE